MSVAQVDIDDDFDDNAYSKFLPPHLQERYRQSIQDPHLTHLSRQISLMDIRITTLLQTLDHQILTPQEIEDDLRIQFPHLGEEDIRALALFVMSYLPDGYINHRTFKRLESLIDRYKKAELDGHIREANRYRNELFESIRSGRQEGDVWEKITDAMEERRKLGDAEERRIAQNQSSLRLEQVVLLMRLTINAFKESVNKYVEDREIQQYLLSDVERTYAQQLGLRDSSKTD